METTNNGGYLDTFSGLLGQYFTFKAEEAKAEATGAAQYQHSNVVETAANVNQTPNQTPTGAQGFSLSTNQMMIGGALLLGVVLVLNK